MGLQTDPKSLNLGLKDADTYLDTARLGKLFASLMSIVALYASWRMSFSSESAAQLCKLYV